MAKRTKYDKKKLVESLQTLSNVAYMAKLDDARWLLEFVEGGFNENEAWFLKTTEGKEFVALPQFALQNLLGHIQQHNEEKFLMLLRYEIRELMPIDLEDTMAVALHEFHSYKQSNGNIQDIDAKAFAKNIKLAHPNLFLRLDSIFKL
ncbi:DUF2603 domain-containing protein [Helicobacter bilis]|uniref:DUF2603 domain-containing protein n=2 Tax=Helicobacter bilis TaxID=37372 RepID=A0A6D2C8Z3_9HELI|nr:MULTISPECIES: DUF2603 domain-containing protein [Helicobacter]EMZ41121.1 hypothetical protein C826_00131 [Helicobacter bilis WiWa]MDY5950351.1 DUF2603 domain-containing protein [Helicobacter sp.]TLE04323.1 DUF2603 domain-containing protein [Helicobacter bilis]TLE05371.1 DUF2603 domain-containing protein [Helicobacter bilis]